MAHITIDTRMHSDHIVMFTSADDASVTSNE